MIVVLYYAGIGNQMYQHALSIVLKNKYPDQIIKVDASMFRETRDGDTNNFSYGLGMKTFFDIDVDVAELEEVKEVFYGFVPTDRFIAIFPRLSKQLRGCSIYAELRAKFVSKYKRKKECFITNAPFEAYNGNIFQLDKSNNYYFMGLWQNLKYFEGYEDEIRKQFQLKADLTKEDKLIVREIENTNSICLHVRRGNFTLSKHKYSHDICTMEYYEKALKQLEEELNQRGINHIKYFLFSDDEEYCKEKFSFLKSAVYAGHSEPDKSNVDMYMMSKCKHAIIPNSTFAFWAIWLSDHKDKIVICPKYSVRDKSIWHEFSVPEHWIKIDNLEYDDGNQEELL